MRTLPLIVVVAAMTLALSAGFVTAGSGTVRTTGTAQFVPNALIMSNLAFHPGGLHVATGDTVSWMHADQTEDPHTVTVVEELPATIEEVFDCQAPPFGACAKALANHFATVPPTLVVNVGASGLNAPDDSLLFFHGQTTSAAITAPAGSTVKYLCAIHPWMQGTIMVR